MKSKAPIPAIGTRARGSRSGRPIMVALDLLGRRNALRILWELRSGEPLTFRALQDAAQTNPALLNTRLKELRAAELVEHDSEGYRLTSRGRELSAILLPLVSWSETWAAGLARGDAQKKKPRSKAGL